MIVKIDKHGRLSLSDLFTKKQLKDICAYGIDKSDTGIIRLYFYDFDHCIIPVKLRKHVKAKKA